MAKSLEFDEEGFRSVVSGIENLKVQLPDAIQKCLAYFMGVDRTVGGYEGLIAAQECLPNNDVRDAFAVDYSTLAKLWEALSPDPMLQAYEQDYRWLSQVYVSVQPTTGQGQLIWHALGAKTIELIHENVHVEAIRRSLGGRDGALMQREIDDEHRDERHRERHNDVSHHLGVFSESPPPVAAAEHSGPVPLRHCSSRSTPGRNGSHRAAGAYGSASHAIPSPSGSRPCRSTPGPPAASNRICASACVGKSLHERSGPKGS